MGPVGIHHVWHFIMKCCDSSVLKSKRRFFCHCRFYRLLPCILRIIEGCNLSSGMFSCILVYLKSPGCPWAHILRVAHVHWSLTARVQNLEIIISFSQSLVESYATCWSLSWGVFYKFCIFPYYFNVGLASCVVALSSSAVKHFSVQP